MKDTSLIETIKEAGEVLVRYYEVMGRLGEVIASLISNTLDNRFKVRYAVGGIEIGGVELREDPHVIGVCMEDTREEDRRLKNHEKYCIDIHDAIAEVYPELQTSTICVKGSFKLSKEEAERLKEILLAFKNK